MVSIWLSSMILGLYAGCHAASTIGAFMYSSGVFAHRHNTNRELRDRFTSMFAIFQDDDCEDLCDAFAVVSTNDISMKSGGDETKVARDRNFVTLRSPRPRHARALWSADPGPDKCPSCQSGGVMTCRFCGGTSMMSAIGGETDTLFYEGIGKDCPVCDDGLEVCGKCAGTGWIFSWSKNMVQ